METYRLAFLGFGNVGRALARLLLEKERQLREEYGVEFRVTAIATAHHGMALHPQGINLEQALETDHLSTLSLSEPPHNIFDFVRSCEAEVLFESIPVNYESGQPALDALRMALEKGMHVVTANKGPVIYGYSLLKRLAKEKGKHFLFEATVMDGTPIFSLFRETLPGACLTGFVGILNSTTNMILSLMEEGSSFEESVLACQQMGIAETDPAGDIDGWDAAIKVALLVTVLMKYPLKPQQVEREGIRELSATTVREARKAGKRWKLLCRAERTPTGVKTSVKPELVNENSPFYRIGGTSSAIQFETDVLGSLFITQSNPSTRTTAYGMFADFLQVVG